MDVEKFTDRAKGFLQSAQGLALREGHQRFLPEHLLKVLLDDSEGMATNLIQAAGGNAQAAQKAVAELLRKQPKVEGGGAGQLYMAPETARLLDAAQQIAKKAGDSFVTVEQLLLAIAMSETDAGRALARHANRVLAELESLHVEMASFGHGLRGTVRLLCNTAAMSEALPRTIGHFLITNPDLDVDVQELPSEAVIDALRRGTADIGIVANYVDTSGLLVRQWLDDRLVVLLPSRWAIGRRRSIAFGELLEHPLVGLARDSGLGRFLATQASRSGRIPRHRVRLGGFDAIAQVVATGVGAAVMPDKAAARYCRAGTRIVALSDAWAFRRLLVCMTPLGSELPSVQGLADALYKSVATASGVANYNRLPPTPCQQRK